MDRLASQNFEVGGLRFYGLTVFAGYSTSALPLSQAGAALGSPGAATLGPDENYGFSATLGWQIHHQRTDLSVLYSGTYQGSANYSDLNAYSQSLTVNSSRYFTPKLRLTFSGTAQDMTLAEFLFQPSTILTQAPSNFNDLAAAASIGAFTNSQIAAMLTASPVLQSPVVNSLIGTRILSYSGQLSLEYQASQRLRFHFASLSAGAQSRLNGEFNSSLQNGSVPRTFGLNAGAGFSYMLSPRTDLGFTAEENRFNNVAQKAYTSNAYATIGRKMGMRWFLQAHAGGSIITPVGSAPVIAKGHQIIGGGSIGFRTFRHSLIGTYERNTSDTYGFAVGTVSMYTGTWLYHAPGSRWTLFSTYSQEQIRNAGFVSMSGWQATGGISQMLSRRTTLTAQYVYLSNTGTYNGSPTSFAVQSVRLSLGWSPQPGQSVGAPVVGN